MHKSWDNTIVGRALVRERDLVLETNSLRRADDLRSKIEAGLESLVRHRARDHQDPEAMLKLGRDPRVRPPSGTEKGERPAPELLETLRDFKRRHFESWLDTPMPKIATTASRQRRLALRDILSSLLLDESNRKIKMTK